MNEKWVSALFSKFQVRYGHKWTSAMPSPELIRLGVCEWSEQLAGLTGEQVKKGLNSWSSDWPPSCTEFRSACLNKGGDLHKFGAYKLFKKLPKPAGDRDIAASHLANMKMWLKR